MTKNRNRAPIFPVSREYKKTSYWSHGRYLKVFAVLLWLLAVGAQAQTRGALPIEGPLSFEPEANVLSANSGVDVVEPAGSPGVGRLIDGSARSGWRSERPFVPGQPVTITLSLPEAKRIASVLLQPHSGIPGATSPRELELSAADAMEPENFHSLGRYSLNDSDSWQSLTFSAADVKNLMITILAVNGEGPVGLGEIAAFPPGVDPRAPLYRFNSRDTLDSGSLRVSLLSAEIGTRAFGRNAGPGKLLVSATLEVLNTQTQWPVIARVSDYLVLLEGGHFIYEMDEGLNFSASAFEEQYEYLPGVAVSGTVVFEIPDDTGDLELAYLAAGGPVFFDLTPELEAPDEPVELASSNLDGYVTVVLYGIEKLGQTHGLRLDLGLRLSSSDPSLVLPLRPAEDFMLIDRQNRRYTSDENAQLRRAFGETLVRFLVTSRGEIEFPQAPVSGEYALVLPFEDSDVVMLLPSLTTVQQARKGDPYEAPEVIPPQAVRNQVQRPDNEAPENRESGRTSVSPQKQAAPLPSTPSMPRIRVGIPDVMNTGLLSIGGELIPLYGVVGEYAPHSTGLNSFIRDRAVTCEPVGQESFRCTLEGQDISEVVLANGGGRVTSSAPANLKAAEAEARAAGKGVWRRP